MNDFCVYINILTVLALPGPRPAPPPLLPHPAAAAQAAPGPWVAPAPRRSRSRCAARTRGGRAAPLSAPHAPHSAPHTPLRTHRSVSPSQAALADPLRSAPPGNTRPGLSAPLLSPPRRGFADLTTPAAPPRPVPLTPARVYGIQNHSGAVPHPRAAACLEQCGGKQPSGGAPEALG